MNRQPLVNVPRQKKAPKPLKRATKPIERRAPLPRPTARINPVGKVGQRKMDAKALALRTYFKLQLPGHLKVEDDWKAPCQACAYPLFKRHADPAHKERAWKGDDRPANILALHRLCHDWMDADKARERVAIADPASCARGGVVQWPEAMRQSLLAEIKAYYAVRDFDGTT